jgi:microcystin-dependent protein
MTLHVTHLFVSAKGDGPDSTLVRPSAASGGWNADHKLVTDSTAPIVLGRQSPGAGVIEELPISVIFPVGVVVPYAGGTAPGGWLLCAGQSLLQADYLALYGVIQQVYGGDSTHFSLPDMRGSVAAGKSNMGGADKGNMPNGALLGYYQGYYQNNTGSFSMGGTTRVNFGNAPFTFQSATGTVSSTTDIANGTGSTVRITGDREAVNISAISGYTSLDTGNYTIGVGGTSGNFSVLQPTVILNYIIKT